MNKEQRVVGVIPARLASTRLPRKVLRTLAGKPMLAWVVEAARACSRLDQVVVATDSDEVMALAAAHGWSAMLTSAALQSGSDRVCAVAGSVAADIYVNIQGDEPLLLPEHIDALLAPFGRLGDGAQVSTLWTHCPADEVGDPNVVKVVLAEDGRALYFSRTAIPYYRDGQDRDGASAAQHAKHIGMYAYRRAALERFASLPAGRLEQIERLEQLRLLEHGIAIHAEYTPYATIGVDTEADVERAAAALASRHERIFPPANAEI
ncbi:MAG: 3-deoxy-manno-octulosonate cytidylyltransferase [Acidobacteriaceae bacterium]